MESVFPHDLIKSELTEIYKSVSEGCFHSFSDIYF